MIREDEERIGELPSNLRHAISHPEPWDVPGLLADAAERIEWLEKENGETHGEVISAKLECERRIIAAQGEFAKHAEAAQVLYCEIYSLAVNTLGWERIPCGSTPLAAVKLIASALRETKATLGRVEP